MRHIAPHRLWIGHAGDARDLRRLIDLGIEAVVDLAENEPPFLLPREMVCCRFPLIDGSGNPPWLLQAAVNLVSALCRARVPTLVCCSAGMSRSPAIAAAGLSLACGSAPVDCLASLSTACPVDVSPGLWHDVEASLRADDAASH